MSPIGLGIAISVAYLVCHWVFDGVFDLVWGFADNEQPAWRSELWWADLVNAAMMGFVPAALRSARSGIERDLDRLQPRLRCSKFRARRSTPRSSSSSMDCWKKSESRVRAWMRTPTQAEIRAHVLRRTEIIHPVQVFPRFSRCLLKKLRVRRNFRSARAPQWTRSSASRQLLGLRSRSRSQGPTKVQAVTL